MRSSVIVDLSDAVDPRIGAAAYRQSSEVIAWGAAESAVAGAWAGAGARGGLLDAVDHASGDVVICVRGGVRPAPGACDGLATALEAMPDAGLVAPLVVSRRGRGSPSVVVDAGYQDDGQRENIHRGILARQPFLMRDRSVAGVGGGACAFRRRDWPRLRERLQGTALWDHALSAASRCLGMDVVVVGRARFGADGQSPGLPAASATREPAGIGTMREDGLLVPESAGRRIAWLSPLPPARTGVADYTGLLLPAVAAQCVIDVFWDAGTGPVPDDDVLRRFRVYPMADLERRMSGVGYADVIYHLGNNGRHSAILDWALRVPGTAVLHEYILAGAAPRIPNEKLLTALARVSRRFLVHSRHTRGLLARAFPSLRIDVAQHPARVALEAPAPSSRSFTVVCAGLIQKHKRIHKVVEAFVRFARGRPAAELVLAGEAQPPSYGEELLAVARNGGVEDRVTLTGWLDRETFDRRIATADVIANLRSPIGGEQSGQIARAAGKGVPLIVSDIDQFRELPDFVAHRVPYRNEVEGIVEALERAERRRRLPEGRADRAATFRWAAAELDPHAVARQYVAHEPAARGRRGDPRLLVLPDVSDTRDDTAFLADDLGAAGCDVGVPFSTLCRIPRTEPIADRLSAWAVSPAREADIALGASGRLAELLDTGLPVVVRVTRSPRAEDRPRLARCALVLAATDRLAAAVRDLDLDVRVATLPRVLDYARILSYAAYVQGSRPRTPRMLIDTDADALDTVLLALGSLAHRVRYLLRVGDDEVDMERQWALACALGRANAADAARGRHVELMPHGVGRRAHWRYLASCSSLFHCRATASSRSLVEEATLMGMPCLTYEGPLDASSIRDRLRELIVQPERWEAETWAERDQLLRVRDDRARAALRRELKQLARPRPDADRAEVPARRDGRACR